MLGKLIDWYNGRYKIYINWDVKNVQTGKLLKPYIMRPSWYKKVHLWKKWVYTHHSIHRLVAQYFIPNPENKPQVNHKDSNRLNNDIDNLEWATASENVKHWYKYGFMKSNLIGNTVRKGKFWKDNPSSKKINQYTMNGEFIRSWDSGTDIHKELWFNRGNISSCCTWRKWRKAAHWYTRKFAL